MCWNLGKKYKYRKKNCTSFFSFVYNQPKLISLLYPWKESGRSEKEKKGRGTNCGIFSAATFSAHTRPLSPQQLMSLHRLSLFTQCLGGKREKKRKKMGPRRPLMVLCALTRLPRRNAMQMKTCGRGKWN